MLWRRRIGELVLASGRHVDKYLPFLITINLSDCFLYRALWENCDCMKYEKYPTKAAGSLLEFEFNSEGPKGPIKKQVNFQAIADAPAIYNLVFGDQDSKGKVNDLIITDNKDGIKVLATVVDTLYKFFEKHPGSFVYAEGSTKARTRLYRIGISNNLAEIENDFQVFGYINSTWEPFERNRDYERFLVRKI
jgi:hypothetical protein